MSIIKVKDQEGNLINIPAFKGPQGEKGENGKDGAVFIPSVAENGDLSWSNNGGLQNPDTINIKGPKGDKGDSVNVDNTLTQSGQAADAKIVGDRFEEINNTLENFSALDKGLLPDGTDLNSVSEYGMYLLAPNYNYINTPIQCGYLLVLPSEGNNNIATTSITTCDIVNATDALWLRDSPGGSTAMIQVPYTEKGVTVLDETLVKINNVNYIRLQYQGVDGWGNAQYTQLNTTTKNLSDISNSTGVNIDSTKTFSQIAISFDGSAIKRRSVWSGIAYEWSESSNLIKGKDYGYTLPPAGNPGRIYYKKVT